MHRTHSLSLLSMFMGGAQFNKTHPEPLYTFLPENRNKFCYKYNIGVNTLHGGFFPNGRGGNMRPGLLFTNDPAEFYDYSMVGYALVPDDANVLIKNDAEFETDSLVIYPIIPVSEMREWKNLQFCLDIVKKDGYALRYIEDQTVEMCLMAVQQNGWALQYVKCQTKEICLEAVKQEPYALECVGVEYKEYVKQQLHL